MRKLLVIMMGALALTACSTEQAPKPGSVIILDNCSDTKALVKSNNEKISQAFINNDANAIGTLELQNRAIVHAAPACFPKLQQQIKYWKQLHKDME